VVLQVFFLVCAAAAYVVAFAPTVGQGVRPGPGTFDAQPNTALRMSMAVEYASFVLVFDSSLASGKILFDFSFFFGLRLLNERSKGFIFVRRM